MYLSIILGISAISIITLSLLFYFKHHKSTKLEKDVEYKGALKKEAKVLQALLIASISALCISFLLEFQFNNIPHYQYYSNIALGVSGSAIISVIVIYIPYRDKKKSQIDSIGKCLHLSMLLHKRILIELTKTILVVESPKDIETKAYSILQDANIIKRQIEKANHLYDHKVEFKSLSIKAIITYFNNGLTKSMYYCESFCNTLIEQCKNNTLPNPEKCKENIRWVIKQMCNHFNRYEYLPKPFPNNMPTLEYQEYVFEEMLVGKETQDTVRDTINQEVVEKMKS